MKYEITAIEQDLCNTCSVTIWVDARDDMSKDDVIEAIKKSCTDFCKTIEGREIYEEHFKDFNYEDFNVYVPNDICKKYGIEKVSEPDRIPIYGLDLGECLVDEEELEEEENFGK